MNLPPRLAVLVLLSTVLAVAIAQNAIKCKYDGSFAEDPCQRISELSSSGDNYLDTLVPIATKNADDSYTVKGFGVAVAEDYILTAISTKFRHYGNEDLYIIFNKNVYPLKAPKVYPDIFIGKYNLKAWQDLSLVKLHPASNLKFTKFMKINGNTGIAADIMQSRKKVLSFSNDKLQIAQPVLQRPDECKTMFARDVLHFDPAYMTCSNEANEKDKEFLRGAPIAYFAGRNELVLFGIHSLDSLHGPGYLITYTAPHCGWLSSVSNGVVTCVSTSILTGSTSTLEAEKATTTAKEETTTKATTTVKVPDTTTTQLPTQQPRAKREVCLTRDCVIGAALYHTNMNEAVNPCDDFYEFTCGNFHLHHDLPADRVEYDIFSGPTSQRVMKQVQHSLSKPTTPSEKPYETLAKQLFQKCMDEKKVDETGPAVLNKFLSKFHGGVPFLGGTGFTGSWESFFAKSYKFSNVETPFSLSFSYHPDDTSKWLIKFTQIPAFQIKDYSKYKEGMSSKMLQEALKMMIKVAKKLGATDQAAQKDMKDVLELEMKLANAADDIMKVHDPMNFEVLSFGKLKKKYENKIDFQVIADVVIKDFGPFSDNTDVLLSSPTYFDKMVDILKATDKKVIANMIIFTFLKDASSMLHKDIANLFADFGAYQQGLENSPPKDRLTLCYYWANNLMGIATSRLYINDHYDQAKVKPKMEELTDYIRNYFIEEVKTATWLDENTRNEALNKANALKKVIGYPDWIYDDTLVDAKYLNHQPTTDAESFVELGFRLSITDRDNLFRDIFNPSSAKNVIQSLAELNAAYYPNENAIYFYAAMLQYPMFMADAPSYVRFGTIGETIGHEIQHGYDSTGRQYDAKGSIRDWWAPETLKKFEDKTQCFIDQYNGYGVDGQYSVGENAADNAGLKTAFGAYKKWLADHPDVVEPILPGFKNYTPEQLFFISWANNYCSIVDLEKRKRIIDTHVASYIRIKGVVQNIEALEKAFNCPAKPGTKCEIWE